MARSRLRALHLGGDILLPQLDQCGGRGRPGRGVYQLRLRILGGGQYLRGGVGLRCAGGTFIRLGSKTYVGGASQYPEAGNPSVSVRGAVTSPGTREYQVWYRNAAAFCTPSTFNLTNGLEITWM